MITSISPNLLSDINPYNILNAKTLNRKCEVLLSQIEELRNNYHSMIINKYNREYTFIKGQRLTHIEPYKSEKVYNIEKCKALCSSDNNCYGFNKSDSYSWFGKPRVQCDYFSKNDVNGKNVSIESDPEYKLYINMNDENIKSTKRILDELISSFFSTCGRSMDIIESFASTSELSANNSEIFALKDDLTQQQKRMIDITNDIIVLDKEYSNSSLSISHNNTMLSIYIFIIVILIIVAIKNIVII